MEILGLLIDKLFIMFLFMLIGVYTLVGYNYSVCMVKSF